MLRSGSSFRPKIAFYLLWLGAVPLVCHLIFSSLGFNPTDDGLILAYARAVLSGQVPYRDVLSVHMPGSFYLWAPVVAMGGNDTLWIARGLVWLEEAVIALCWVTVLTRLLRLDIRSTERFALCLLAFIFDVHTFPIMPWHTTDALLFVALGLALATAPSGRWRLLGYALIGASPLFRQNFAVVPPLVILALPDRRDIRVWTAAILPGVIFGLYLLVMGALPDAVTQLTAQHEILRFGWDAYRAEWRYLVLGASMGIALAALLDGERQIPVVRLSATIRSMAAGLLVAALVVDEAVHLAQAELLWGPSFTLFGVVGGVLFYALIARADLSRLTPAGVIVLGTAWAASLSVGYNTPADMDGILLVFVAVVLRRRGSVPPTSAEGRPALVALGLAGAFALGAFGWARTNHIYRSAPAPQLTYRLDDVLPGGGLLRTDARTYAYLRDLHDIVRSLHGKPYTILPDCAACWVQSRQTNWLGLPWPSVVELDAPTMQQRVIQTLASRRGHVAVLVSRVSVADVAQQEIPISPISNPITWYVSQQFRLWRQTRYFDVYI